MEITVKINDKDFMNFLKVLTTSNLKIEGIMTDGMKKSSNGTITMKSDKKDNVISNYPWTTTTTLLSTTEEVPISECKSEGAKSSKVNVTKHKDFSETPLRMTGNCYEG